MPPIGKRRNTASKAAVEMRSDFSNLIGVPVIPIEYIMPIRRYG
jgi:hypothetical protein